MKIIILNEDLTIDGNGKTIDFSSNAFCTISLSGEIEFDGQDKKLILNDCSGWFGFIQVDNDSSGNRPTIKNLDISGNNGTNLGLIPIGFYLWFILLNEI